MNTELIRWLQDQLRERGWSQSELARRAGLSHAQVSHVLGGARGAGIDFCTAIAGPLGVPPATILKLAGYLPKTYQPGRDNVTRLLEAAASLSDADLEELIALAEVKRQRAPSATLA